MSLKAKTTRTENDLVKFANDNNIPLASLDHTVNSSGMFTVFHADPYSDHGTVIYGTDDSTGAAPGTSFANALSGGAYTERFNVANTKVLTLWLTVVASNNTKMEIYVRESRMGDPDVDTATDWYLPRFESDPSGSGTVKLQPHLHEVLQADMNVAGGKYVFTVPTGHANWVSLVFVGNGAHRITVIAEASH
jgi:hypothetical protein